MSDNTILTRKLFDAEAILAGASATSSAVVIGNNRVNGVFGIQLEVTGDGTVTVEYALSINGVDYITSFGVGSEIVTGFTKTSGPDSNGKCMYSFAPMVATNIKIIVTETGGADAVAVSLWLAIQ